MKKIYDNPEFEVKKLSLIDIIMSSTEGDIPSQGNYDPADPPGDDIPDDWA